jgi:hypothetical protein
MLLFYPKNKPKYDKIIRRKKMMKLRKWKLFGLFGVLLGGLALLTSRFFRQRKARRPIY